MVPLLVAGRDPALPDLVDHDDLIELFPEATQNARNPFLWKATLKANGRSTPLAIVPDRLFSLHVDNTRRNYALELDRGTMTIAPRTLSGASIAKKYLAYMRGWEERQHEVLWGFRQLRVLMVTTTPARADAMRSALLALPGRNPTGMFLFTTLDAVRRDGPYAHIWQTADGKPSGLL
jgi:hypothetical protein